MSPSSPTSSRRSCWASRCSAPLVVTSAADIVWEHWRDGRRLSALPGPVSPRTRADGYAIQAALDGRSALPLFGWKIAATSVAGQATSTSTARLPAACFVSGCTSLARRCPSAPTACGSRRRSSRSAWRSTCRRGRGVPVDEVLDAVDTLHPAIEIPDSRYDDFTLVGAPQLIADNACAHYFVLGPATTCRLAARWTSSSMR